MQNEVFNCDLININSVSMGYSMEYDMDEFMEVLDIDVWGSRGDHNKGRLPGRSHMKAKWPFHGAIQELYGSCMALPYKGHAGPHNCHVASTWPFWKPYVRPLGLYVLLRAK